MYVPEEMKKETDKYWHDNDIYMQFVEEKVDMMYIIESKDLKDSKESKDNKEFKESKIPNLNVKLSISDVFQCFRFWFKNNFPGSKDIPNRNVLQTGLTRLWGRPMNGCWRGVSLREDEDNRNFGIKPTSGRKP